MGNAADFAAVFDEHLRDEFELHDAAATMMTMSKNPHLYHVPTTMAGGNGRDGNIRVLSRSLRVQVAKRHDYDANLADDRRRSARR